MTKAKDWRESNKVQDEISALWTLSKFDLILNSVGSPHKPVIFQSFVKQKMRVKVSHKAYDNCSPYQSLMLTLRCSETL